MDYLTLLDTPSCSFANLEAKCKIDVRKFGDLDISATLNPCVSPPEVDLAMKMSKYGEWDFNFLSGNPLEIREIGPDYWPLWLRVFLDDGDPRDTETINNNPGINPIHRLAFKACVEVAKTGETLCFMNETTRIPGACPSTAQGISKSALSISIFAIILLLLFFTLFSAGVILWRRWATSVNYKQHKNVTTVSSEFNHSQQPLPSSQTPPPLPNSKQYVIYEEDEEDLCPECKRSRHELSDCTLGYGINNKSGALDSTVTDCLLSASSSPNRKRDLLTFNSTRASFRESKLVQTSLTSLLATGVNSPLAGNLNFIDAQVKEGSSQENNNRSSASSGVSSNRESPV